MLLLLILIYIAVGLAVGVPFALRGVNRIDPAASASPWVFRAVILPGCVGLWPVVLMRMRGLKSGGDT